MNISATQVLLQSNFFSVRSIKRLAHCLQVSSARRAKLYVVTLI